MDKIAANNHFVTLRKEVKKAKAMVCGNLIRKITKLRKEEEKLEDEKLIAKIQGKIANILNEIKLIKTIDSYLVAKNATLRPDPSQWDKVISDCKVTVEERAMARLIVKNNVQKQVLKFRGDHKDCDEWLNEYIEFREKKRELKEMNTKTFKRKPNDAKGQKNKSKEVT